MLARKMQESAPGCWPEQLGKWRGATFKRRARNLALDAFISECAGSKQLDFRATVFKAGDLEASFPVLS